MLTNAKIRIFPGCICNLCLCQLLITLNQSKKVTRLKWMRNWGELEVKYVVVNYHSFLYMLQCNNGPMKTINDSPSYKLKSFFLAICFSKLAVQVEMEKASV